MDINELNVRFVPNLSKICYTAYISRNGVVIDESHDLSKEQARKLGCYAPSQINVLNDNKTLLELIKVDFINHFKG